MAVTASQVATWGDFPAPPAGDELDLLELVIGAVTAHVIKRYQVAATDDQFDDIANMAVLLQSARLWKRRGTPEGVLEFAELGVVRVSRLDPDVAELLIPRYGFA